MEVLEAKEAARRAHLMIHQAQELMVAANRALAAGGKVMVNMETMHFCPTNTNCHDEIVILCGDASKNTFNSK
jgi:hypothetical protein